MTKVNETKRKENGIHSERKFPQDFIRTHETIQNPADNTINEIDKKKKATTLKRRIIKGSNQNISLEERETNDIIISSNDYIRRKDIYVPETNVILILFI